MGAQRRAASHQAVASREATRCSGRRLRRSEWKARLACVAIAVLQEARLLDKDRLDVRFLWQQQVEQEGRLEVLSVPTSENLSDTFTKSQSQVDADRCHRCLNFHTGNVGSRRH